MLLPELTAYLAARSIGTVGTDIFYGLEPTEKTETPLDYGTVTLYEYDGMANEPELGGTTTRIEHPRVHVRVRGNGENSYDAACQKCRDIIAAFARIGVDFTTLSGTKYQAVLHLNGPAFLMWDDNYNPIFVANFQVMKDFQ